MERITPSRGLNEFGDVEQGFAEADVVREFTYQYNGGIPLPFQPGGGVAKWDGDKLTFWGMGQGIHTNRAGLARGLGIDESQVRYINKWNGCTLGGALALTRLDPWIAHIAKQAGRPARLMLPKDHELAHLQTKPQNIQMFKVGATKAGKILACQRTYHINVGNNPRGGNGGTVRTLHPHNSQLEGNRVPVSHQLDADRPLSQQHAAGDQVGLGTDDGRNGGSRGDGSRRVPAAERAETRDEGVDPAGRSHDDRDA